MGEIRKCRVVSWGLSSAAPPLFNPEPPPSSEVKQKGSNRCPRRRGGSSIGLRSFTSSTSPKQEPLERSCKRSKVEKCEKFHGLLGGLERDRVVLRALEKRSGHFQGGSSEQKSLLVFTTFIHFYPLSSAGHHSRNHFKTWENDQIYC